MTLLLELALEKGHADATQPSGATRAHRHLQAKQGKNSFTRTVLREAPRAAAYLTSLQTKRDERTLQLATWTRRLADLSAEVEAQGLANIRARETYLASLTACNAAAQDSFKPPSTTRPRRKEI